MRRVSLDRIRKGRDHYTETPGVPKHFTLAKGKSGTSGKSKSKDCNQVRDGRSRGPRASPDCNRSKGMPQMRSNLHSWSMLEEQGATSSGSSNFRQSQSDCEWGITAKWEELDSYSDFKGALLCFLVKIVAANISNSCNLCGK